MTLLDRLKLARDDFDQQEKLYNTLVGSLRFYVGLVALLGGWSLSLAEGEISGTGWDGWVVRASTILFWAVLAVAIYNLFQLFRGDHWTLPRTFDHYIKWESDRFKQIKTGEFELGDKSPEQFAEDEMLAQMTGAYADSACVNRSANLLRQTRLTKVGKVLLIAVIFLGIQGATVMIYSQRHVKQPEQPKTSATAPSTAGSGGSNRS